jgi:predicted lipoprotein
MIYRYLSSYSSVSLAALACVVALGCRKPPPDENVKPGGGADRAGQGGEGAVGGGGRDGGSGANAGADRDGGVNAQRDAAGDTNDRDASSDERSAGKGGGGKGGAGKGGGGGDGGHGDDAGVLPTPPFTKPGLLAALGDCARSHYDDFEVAAQALKDAARGYADAPDAEHAQAARDAWKIAMASWERAELFRFGPAAASTEPGGQDLRDQIYIFPLFNPCKVDQQTVSKAYAAAGFDASLANTRGLSAIEYLLFDADTGNACASAIDINSNGAWAALGGDEVTARRAAYAYAASSDVLARARALVDAWKPSAGDFYTKWTQPGGSGAVFALDQDALNAASNALFYVEKELKDWKLGWPLGLTPDCIDAPGTCPNAVESRYARVSTDDLRQNLIGFRSVFQGCGAGGSGLGFDDWLEKVGAGELASRMLSALDGAQQAVDDLDPPLEQAIVSDPSKVAAVHAAVKKLTDLLKTEFVGVLNLELPMTSEGDND